CADADKFRRNLAKMETICVKMVAVFDSSHRLTGVSQGSLDPCIFMHIRAYKMWINCGENCSIQPQIELIPAKGRFVLSTLFVDFFV
ncbi:MAG: hypothetical protein IJO80_02415, partial [Firmicutes bacterium]|nr:hypothetical protein [Bacillota bacterium]